MAEELLNLTAYELAEKIEAREVSALEAAEVANARVEETENDVRAFVTVTPELALDRAERVDARIKNGGVKFWEGVPIAVKDVLSTRGVRTTCGSKIPYRNRSGRWSSGLVLLRGGVDRKPLGYFDRHAGG
ncbi:MAG TPA: amidase family protein, partial [Rubrobacteraceae bacterium]|nr:amidase family protein [Rubrobacteraceae bacterium]